MHHALIQKGQNTSSVLDKCMVSLLEPGHGQCQDHG